MKNKFMRLLVGTFFGLLLVFGGTQIFVSGQEDEKSASKYSNENFGPGYRGCVANHRYAARLRDGRRRQKFPRSADI